MFKRRFSQKCLQEIRPPRRYLWGRPVFCLETRQNKNALWTISAIFSLAFSYFCLLSNAFALSEKESPKVVATDARLGGDSLRTRFVADLSNTVAFRLFTLADPYRVIVDMPNVNFQLKQGIGTKGRGLVSAYRYGLFAPGKSRIVIDLHKPALIDKVFVIKPNAGQPARFVIDFVPTDRKTFIDKQTEQRKRVSKLDLPQEVKKSAVRTAQISPGSGLKSIGESNKKPLVVVDPGHGGIDSGAIGSGGTYEKNVVLEFGKLLKEELKKTGKYKVQMTRETDVFVPLRERVQFARQRAANLFVSIHADAVPHRKAKDVRGATVYTLSEKASDKEAKELAAKENRSDIIAGVDLPATSDEVTSILIDLAQRETKNHSIAFATLLAQNLKRKTRVKKDPLRFANFRVLKAPDVPSVLVELGYLSSQADEKLFKSKKWRKKVAQSIVKSIEVYFSKRPLHQPY